MMLLHYIIIFAIFYLGSSEVDLTEDNSDKQSGRNHHGSATLPGGVGLHTTGAVAVSHSEDGASECR